MTDSPLSRRDLIKSAGTGVLAFGVGVGINERMSRYVVGSVSDVGAGAASSVSDTDAQRLNLTDHTPWRLVRGTFSPTRIESLRSRSDIPFVQPDRWLETLSSSSHHDGDERTVPWGVARIGATTLHDVDRTAAGVDIGIIDSGIDPTHPGVTDNLAPTSVDGAHRSWVSCQGEECVQPWADDGGHGTQVAGIAAAADRSGGVVGVAPEATLHALKVCGPAGRCRTSAMIEAIRYAADRDWDVINLSLGSLRGSPALRAAGEYAVEAGIVPVAAAGNQGRPDSVSYPAAYDEFLGVAATTIDDEIADFSSRGPGVDIAAPGRNICTPVPDGHDTQSGTSMATPHVAGAVGHLIADGASAAEARTRLRETAEDLGTSTAEQGAGLVDVAAALGYEHDGDTGDGVSCPSDASV